MFQYAGYGQVPSSSVYYNFQIDLGSWDTSKVTNMSYMFYNAGYFAKDIWDVGDLHAWNVANVTDHTNFVHSWNNSATIDTSKLPTW